MYSVVVIDDEVTAVEHICTIIQLKCPEFKVIGTADNGQSGMDVIRELKPDLVITDIKMPILSGIELVSKIVKELPQILWIIVSGHQDFEYAKGAIQFGVSDYILKPATPKNLNEALLSIKSKLDNMYYQKKIECVKMMIKGKEIEEICLEKYFPFKSYCIAIMRQGSIPRRFGISNIEMFGTGSEKVFIYGRDEREAMYLFPEELLFKEDFETVINKAKEKFLQEDSFITTVIVKQACGLSELPKRIKLIYKVLDTQIIIGRSQTLVYDEAKALFSQKENPKFIPQESMSQLIGTIKNKKYEDIEEMLKKLLVEWNKERFSQLSIEKALSHLFYMIGNLGADFSVHTSEIMLDEAFFYASNINDLSDNIFTIIKDEVLKIEKDNSNENLDQLFNKIIQYIHIQYANPISLKSICQAFGISQPTLSKLFKTFKDTTFNHYLTHTRIDYAKEIMSNYNNIFIKDVARMVGYNDQFYFSRIFRSVTGMSPSEYIETTLCND